MKRIYCTLLIVALCGLTCWGQQKKRGFQLPEVPVMLDTPEARATFVCEHFWDHFDFADTAYMHLPDINIEDAGGLGSIHNVDQTVSACQRADPADVQQIACQIGTVSGNDGFGIGLDFLFQILIANVAHWIRGQYGQLHTLVFHLVQGPENGVMLQRGGDHMVTGPQNALDGNVQRLGGIGSKRNPLRAFRAK